MKHNSTLQSEILKLLTNGSSLFLIGPADSGKSWFAKNNLLPFLIKQGLRGNYFTDCDEISSGKSEHYDFALIDEVESLQDFEYLENVYPDERPYYSNQYLQKVKTWFEKIALLECPSVYIITRNEPPDIDNFVRHVKKADWDGRKVEVLIFEKRDSLQVKMNTSQNLKLRKPDKADKAAYEEFVREFVDAGEKIMPMAVDPKDLSFDDWLSERRKFDKGIDLPPDKVPATLYFLFNDNKIVGAIHIRHKLNEHLLRVAGNIGYGVAPSERRQGYASYMLQEALKICRRMGLKKVLITCDKINVGSARTIQKNGGVLENEVLEEGKIKQRYWIKL